MGSKIHPPIVAVCGKNLAVLELWDLVTLDGEDETDLTYVSHIVDINIKWQSKHELLDYTVLT